jgi:hypothetical protein
MDQSVIGPDEPAQNDATDCGDIEWELYGSAREASVGYVPFANLDFSTAAKELCRTKRGELKRDSLGPADSTVVEHCPECGGDTLVAVCASNSTNLFCRNCVLCWQVEDGRTRRVNPWTCPGCQLVRTAGSEPSELSSASISS